MKKFLFGSIVGFFAGLYSLLTFLLSNEEIRNAVTDVTARKLIKGTNKFIYDKESLHPMPCTFYHPPSNKNIRGYKSFNFPAKSGDFQYIFATKEDAERVFNEVKDFVSIYRVVTVKDLHDLIGLPVSASDLDTKRGWTDLKDVKLEMLSRGYALTFPNPVIFDLFCRDQ